MAEFTTIRIRSSTHERLRRLSERLAREGWASIGVVRNDKPSMTSIVEEALTRIEHDEEKSNGKERKRQR